MGPGDAVLLRTGHGRFRREGCVAGGFAQTGWHASCLPWLHERGVAPVRFAGTSGSPVNPIATF
ncbi:hypothetical protein [Micromonospora sp. WMMD736]|uniref:hypothetical protein n=1 Tax=Micromonospora sp. WMMD736 TaxID=3404112 RepID=UPI003B93EE1E